MVEWTSAAEVFTSFQERGQKTSDNTSITISPLTPSTKYVFQVAMVTQEGQGAEVRTVVTTEEEVGGTISLLSTGQYGYIPLHLRSVPQTNWHISRYVS